MRFEDGLNVIRQGLSASTTLRRRSARIDLRLLLQSGSEGYVLHLRDGEVLSLKADSGPMHDWDVAFRMGAEDWQGFWAAHPHPGWHDIFALTRAGRLRIEGNLLPLMQNLQVIKDVLALPRAAREVTA